jgi:hypothetical protein
LGSNFGLVLKESESLGLFQWQFSLRRILQIRPVETLKMTGTLSFQEACMRKSVFVFFILLGAALGMFVALNESVGLKIVLGSIGAVAGTAVGGALAGIGRRRHRPMTHFDDVDEFTSEQATQVHNYWLDRGRLTAAPGLPHPDDNDPHSHEP